LYIALIKRPDYVVKVLHRARPQVHSTREVLPIDERNKTYNFVHCTNKKTGLCRQSPPRSPPTGTFHQRNFALEEGNKTYNFEHCTDKKENKIFLTNKEIQEGAVANSYMTDGLLIYD
jgi:hypothetical protein